MIFYSILKNQDQALKGMECARMVRKEIISSAFNEFEIISFSPVV